MHTLPKQVHAGHADGWYPRWGKRVLDITLAGAGLVCLAPLFATLALVVRVSSPGPVFHISERRGRYGHPFRILKFRTMYRGAHVHGPVTAHNDGRVTPIGKLLRRTKLDELPQLVNILRGEMSIVGPRPLEIREAAGYARPEALQAVRPGLTDRGSLYFLRRQHDCMANGVPYETIRAEKDHLSLLGLADQSFHGDLVLILRTVLACVR